MALLALARQQWFGAGDLRVFIVYTSIFSVIVAAVGLRLFHILARFPIWICYLAGGVVGLGLGFLFTVGNRMLLGGWFGAWSIPVFIAWLGGGMLGVAAATGTRSGVHARRLGAEALIFICLLLALSVGVPLLGRTLTHDQHLTLVYARWYPSDSQLDLQDPHNTLLADDRELLNRASVHGRVVVRGGHASNTVEYPKARMVILLTGPMTERAQLAQPYASEVLYLQEGTAFGRYPPDAHVLDRVVELSPDPNRPGVIGFMVDLASGARSGADLINWNREPSD